MWYTERTLKNGIIIWHMKRSGCDDMEEDGFIEPSLIRWVPGVMRKSFNNCWSRSCYRIFLTLPHWLRALVYNIFCTAHSYLRNNFFEDLVSLEQIENGNSDKHTINVAIKLIFCDNFLLKLTIFSTTKNFFFHRF